MNAESVIDEYLDRLSAASRQLPGDRRAELVNEVREHIAAAIGETGRKDELTVRNVLERLGTPEDIVAAEEGLDAAPQARSGTTDMDRRQGGTLGGVEIAALLLLTVGWILLPFVGSAVGLVLVWFSTRWTTKQKAVATAVVVILLFLPVVLLSSAGSQ